jgi:hypothetical protein
MFRLHGGLENELEVLVPRPGPPRLGIGLAVLCVASAVVLAGALVLVVVPNIQKTRDANASMTIEVTVSGFSATIAGATDLPDGALISADIKNIATDEAAYGQAVVHNGRYSTTTMSVGPWQSGLVVANVRFEPFASGQPAAVVDRFGSHGERLLGPDVIVNPIGDRYLSLLAPITVPGA